MITTWSTTTKRNKTEKLNEEKKIENITNIFGLLQYNDIDKWWRKMILVKNEVNDNMQILINWKWNIFALLTNDND